MIDTGLKDKVVIVTGANNKYGIGAATAEAFAREGAKVFLNYLCLSAEEYGFKESEIKKANMPGLPFYFKNWAMTADEVVRQVQESGGQASSWECDLSNPDSIPQLFDRVEETFGPVDVLVNNAAHWKPDTFVPTDIVEYGKFDSSKCRTLQITAKSHDEHFAVNSRAVALMIAEFAFRQISKRINWGRIINVSTDGASGFAGDISYGASKHALESYSRAAAKELGNYGITVNIVSPGATQTSWITPEMEKEIINEYPLNRIGKPEDIADLIVFLASEQARWVTGQLIYAGGGHTMHL